MIHFLNVEIFMIIVDDFGTWIRPRPISTTQRRKFTLKQSGFTDKKRQNFHAVRTVFTTQNIFPPFSSGKNTMKYRKDIDNYEKSK